MSKNIKTLNDKEYLEYISEISGGEDVTLPEPTKKD